MRCDKEKVSGWDVHSTILSCTGKDIRGPLIWLHSYGKIASGVIGARYREGCLEASCEPLVQFSRSVVSDSLWPHELQYTRPLCPSPTPRVHPNPCPLSQWCHPTISSSVIPFSSCLQSFPESGSFQMSQLCIRKPKYWRFSFNIRPSNEHPGLVSFRMDWLDLPDVQGTLKSLLQHHRTSSQVPLF